MIMKKLGFTILISTLVVTLILGFSPFVAHAAIYTFESDTLGKITPFTDTEDGVSATFTSNGDPGGFYITTTMFKDLTGRVLLEPGLAGLDNLELTITFSQPMSSLKFFFALNTSYPDTRIEGILNNGISFDAAGAIPPGYTYPEGFFSGVFPIPFTGVTLSTDALDFAIDNIQVDGAVPEPATMLLLGSGLIGLTGYGRRKFFKK